MLRVVGAPALRPVLGLVITVVVFLILAPGASFTLLDVRTAALHTVIVGTAALGATIVIISGGIDLSIGSAVALASVAAAKSMAMGGEEWLAVVVALGVGAACGLYNGVLITALRLPPFIATLGTLGFFRGVAKWSCGSRPVSVSDVGWLGALVQPEPPPSRQWMLVAPAVWIMLALGAATAFGLKRTLLGRHATAIGSNEDGAARCGIGVQRVKVRVYALAGAFVGLAGVLQFARLTQGDPTVAVGLELDVIAAVVIGGASLAGGHGSVAGTLAGAALMAFLRNRCTVLGWPNYVQEMVVGHIIIAAVALDRWRARKAGR